MAGASVYAFGKRMPSFWDRFRRVAKTDDVDISDVERSRVRVPPYQSRIQIDWDVDAIRAALMGADGGDMTAIARLAVAIERDARVRGILQTRTLGQVSLPIEWKGDARAVAHMRSCWDRVAPKPELARLIAYGLMVGVAPCQIRWVACGPTMIPQIETWDPEWLRFDNSIPSDPYWTIQAYDDPEVVVWRDGEPCDGWALYLPFGADRPWRHGLVQSLASPWLAKQYAVVDRARHSEVNGSPAWVATTVGLSEDQRKLVLSELRAAGSNTRFVLPEGCDVKLIEAQGKTSEIYKETIDWADTEIAIAIAGQTVTTEGTKGFAEGDIHERVLATLIRATAESLADLLNRYVVEPWAYFEFGELSDPPRLAYRTEPLHELTDQAASYQTLGQGLQALQAAMTTQGVSLDLQSILQRYGIPARLVIKPTTPEDSNAAN